MILVHPGHATASQRFQVTFLVTTQRLIRVTCASHRSPFVAAFGCDGLRSPSTIGFAVDVVWWELFGATFGSFRRDSKSPCQIKTNPSSSAT